MARNNVHIIRTQILELSDIDGNAAEKWDARLKHCYYEKIQPQLSEILDKFAGPEVFLQIGKMTLSLPPFPADNWEENFPQAFLQALEAQLREITVSQNDSDHYSVTRPSRRYGFSDDLEPGKMRRETDFGNWPSELRPDNTARTPAARHAMNAFFHFLLTGRLPWWATTAGAGVREWTDTLLAYLDENPAAFYQELKNILREYPFALKRLIQQFPNSLLDKLLDSLPDSVSATAGPQTKEISPDSAPTIGQSPAKDTSTGKLPDSVSSTAAPQTKKTSPVKLPDSPPTIAQLPSKETYTHRFIHKFGLEQKEKPLTASKPSKLTLPDDDNALYLELAGLVLLHPFLSAFFQTLNLLDASGKQFRDPAAQDRAIHLLYYLGVGATEPPEYELLLSKLLCGLPLEEPVARYLDLTEQETTEANTLLQSVITHWQALKNTSPAGLREAFLQRDGKLSRVENGWKLLVERKAQDVLLGRLPWGIGVVKLPWMEEMVWVEWG